MRHRPKKPPPKLLEGVDAGIDTLERNVIRSLVDAPFVPEQVVRWMFHDDVVNKLQAAYAYTRATDRGVSIRERLRLALGPWEVPAVDCVLVVAAEPVKMLVPEHGLARHDDTRGTVILETLRQAYGQHRQFEKVRRVVRWLNTYATVGAARHYCPWLTGVLPAEHPFHSAGGNIFREPTRSMTEIIPVMRECGAIMASALLCGEVPPEDGKGNMWASFTGERVEYDIGNVLEVEYTSRLFRLL